MPCSVWRPARSIPSSRAKRGDLPLDYINWRPSVRCHARSGDRHDRFRHREHQLRLCPQSRVWRSASSAVIASEARRSAFRLHQLETSGQMPCAVWRPARSIPSSRASVAPVPAKQGMAICLLRRHRERSAAICLSSKLISKKQTATVVSVYQGITIRFFRFAKPAPMGASPHRTDGLQSIRISKAVNRTLYPLEMAILALMISMWGSIRLLYA